MTLSLQLSCYNGAHYLPYLFDSLKKQTIKDWTLYILDNASSPKEAKTIQEEVRKSGLPAKLYRLEKNIGFAGAHNFLWQKHSSEAVQLLNDDAFLEPDYLEKLLSYLKENPLSAAVSGVIYRWDFENREVKEGKTSVIDSVGLEMKRSGRVIDRFSGQDASKLNLSCDNEKVLGISGCLPMYRRAAVLKVSPDGNLFDGSYISYKEDIDLALRLLAGGFYSAVVYKAIAFHRRSSGPKTTAKPRPESFYLSYRNHLKLIFEHMNALEFLKNSYAIIPFEIMKGIKILLLRPDIFFSSWYDIFRNFHSIKSKHNFIKQLRKKYALKESGRSI